MSSYNFYNLFRDIADAIRWKDGATEKIKLYPVQAQDGTYGFYDIINQVFLKNEGTGTLTGGMIE